MSGIFDAGSVTWPSGPASSKQTNYKRRAYGTIKAVGNKNFTCHGSQILSFQDLSAPDVKRGGRYAAAPHLTSITTKNHGGGDMSEVALWEIEFQYTVYDKATLDACATSFMIPNAKVNISFGWNTGPSVNIEAEIFDFSWDYSVDNGSWSCTGKALGSAAGGAGGIMIATAENAKTVTDDAGERVGSSIFSQLDIEAMREMGVHREKDGKLTGEGIPGKDGSAKQNGDYGIINAFVESGWFSDTSNYATMVRFEHLLTTLNNAILKSGFKYKLLGGTYPAFPFLRSADPLLLCLPGTAAAYNEGVANNKNNFSGLTGAVGITNNVWVSTQFLRKIEEDLLGKQSDKNTKGEFSANKYLSKLFGEFTNLTGGAMDLAITTDPKDDKIFLIINKKTDINYTGSGSALKLRDVNSPVKSVSMSSNMDPDMMAIAISGKSGQYATDMADNIFGGCKILDARKSKVLPETTEEKLKKKLQELGNKYDNGIVTDLKKLNREYVNDSCKGKGISVRYSIDLSVTTDGFVPSFGQEFTVDPIPASVGSGNVSFVVGEIEHKVDGTTFETTVVGYMMVNT